jgi:hypothetical protein
MSEVDDAIGLREVIDPPEPQTRAWAAVLAAEAHGSACLTVGLAAGSRTPCDRSTVEALVAEVAQELMKLDGSSRTLWIRLEPHEDISLLKRSPSAEERIPVAKRSPLGPWFEVAVPIAKSGQPGRAAHLMPQWLPSWKQSFRLIVIELGAIHWIASRAVGRLCDGCYLLLGPSGCASQEWVMQQIAWHHQSGSTICGTLVATVRSAA